MVKKITGFCRNQRLGLNGWRDGKEEEPKVIVLKKIGKNEVKGW